MVASRAGSTASNRSRWNTPSSWISLGLGERRRHLAAESSPHSAEEEACNGSGLPARERSGDHGARGEPREVAAPLGRV